MRLALALLLPAGPVAADPFALDWLAACRAAAETPAEDGACAEDAIRLVCAYAPGPAACRDTVEATVTAEAFARLAPLAAAEGVSPAALLGSLPGWTEPPDCRQPPPPLTEAGCRGRNVGALLSALAAAEAQR